MAEWTNWLPDFKRLPGDEAARWGLQALFTLLFGTGSMIGLFTWLFGPPHDVTGIGWLMILAGISAVFAFIWVCIEQALTKRHSRSTISKGVTVSPALVPTGETQSTVGPALASGLYVADILPDLQKLDKGYLEFVIRCFNGSGYPASITGTHGAILYGMGDKKGVLGQPSLIPDRGGVQEVAHGLELFPVFSVWINEKDLPGQIEAHLREGKNLNLDLKQLTVWCKIVGLEKPVKLPLWSGISFRRGGERLAIGRIVEAAISIRA